MFKYSRKMLVSIALVAVMVVMVIASLAFATDSGVDFSTVASTIVGYLGSAFTAAATLLALIYGAPLAWRFIKKFR